MNSEYNASDWEHAIVTPTTLSDCSARFCLDQQARQGRDGGQDGRTEGTDHVECKLCFCCAPSIVSCFHCNKLKLPMFANHVYHQLSVLIGARHFRMGACLPACHHQQQKQQLAPQLTVKGRRQKNYVEEGEEEGGQVPYSLPSFWSFESFSSSSSCRWILTN